MAPRRRRDGSAGCAMLAAWAAIVRRALRVADPWTVRKTFSYYALHVCVATLVGYAVTGSWQAAIALSLLEPTVQAVAYYFHERAWHRFGESRSQASLASRAAGGPRQHRRPADHHAFEPTGTARRRA